MKAFIAYRHTGEKPEELKKLLEFIRYRLHCFCMESYCTFFEDDTFKRKNMTSREIMDHAFLTIDKCDFLLVIQSSSKKSEGMILEVGYCIGKKIPIIIATKRGVKNTYLPSMGDYSFTWSNFRELSSGIFECTKKLSKQQKLSDKA